MDLTDVLVFSASAIAQAPSPPILFTKLKSKMKEAKTQILKIWCQTTHKNSTREKKKNKSKHKENKNKNRNRNRSKKK